MRVAPGCGGFLGIQDRLIRIWSLEMQICLQAIAEASELWCLALNAPQTRLVAGSSEKFLHVWSLDHEAKTSEAGDLLLAKFQGAVPRTVSWRKALWGGDAAAKAKGCIGAWVKSMET
ncbi:unnamed protein product [Cladocopium goreaui]|uniref:Small-subunit processome Utp12 domain-containing protein n=1 Tax=Cladocopium goreaui TaxID=2562237 RepID=A0A9P1C7C6_9DINO|nr:unnamed protein product [Cladocopium goreaui]